MIENPEDIIANSDPKLYQAIRSYVPDMPDFRPIETIEGMAIRDEEGNVIIELQDNWGEIVHELDALSYDEQGQIFVDAINSGDVEEVLPYINRIEWIDQFIFSYPALIWLMLKTSPEETIFPILISQGMYLDDIHINNEYIWAIRNKETALIFIDRLKLSFGDIYHQLNKDCSNIGWVYLFIGHPRFPSEKYYVHNTLTEVAKKGCYDAVYLLLNNAKYDLSRSASRAISGAAAAGHFDIINLLLSYSPDVDPSLNDSEALIKASSNGHVDVVDLLLKDGRSDPSAQNNNALRQSSIQGHEKVLELLLLDGRVDILDYFDNIFGVSARLGFDKIISLLLNVEGIHRIPHEALGIAMKYANDHVVKVILQDPRIIPGRYTVFVAVHNVKYGLFKSDNAKERYLKILEMLLQDERFYIDKELISKAIEGDSLDVLTLLLEDGRLIPESDHLQQAVMKGSYDIVKLLLEDGRVDPSANNNSALNISISRNNFDMVNLLLEDERVDPTFDNNKALKLSMLHGRDDITELVRRKIQERKE